MNAARNQTAYVVVLFASLFASPTFADSNTSSNTNLGLTSGAYDQHQGQGQGQEQGQINDSHNQAIAAPVRGQNQNNVAVGGQSGPSVIDSHAVSKNFTTFGPPANAIRSGDCAGEANGISLFSFMAGIGYSHAEESKTCRTNQTIEMTCQNARQFVETGAILSQNNNLSFAGRRILDKAIDMIDMCMMGLKANPINLELRQAYGRTFYVPPPTTARNTQVAPQGVDEHEEE